MVVTMVLQMMRMLALDSLSWPHCQLGALAAVSVLVLAWDDHGQRMRTVLALKREWR